MKYLVFLAVLASVRAETLHYAIDWQSGLSLGEATLSSGQSTYVVNGVNTPRWNFDLDIDAGVPGFAISDHYTSSAGGTAGASAGAEICSTRLDKTVHRGSHKNEEALVFDQEHNTVTRGGREISVSSCARDALSFLQFVRQELAQGRLAPQSTVYLGAGYNVRLEFAGTEQVKKLGKAVDADKLHATIKGPASDLAVDIFFGKDEARTPLAARIPLPLGIFSVELAH